MRHAIVSILLFCLLGVPAIAETAVDGSIRAALEHPDRPGDDRASDDDRKPAEVLNFFEIGPGAHVADMMAGSGWYTEILSRVVGDNGVVYMQNNETSNGVFAEALNERLESSKLTNTRYFVRELESPGFPAGALDAVLMIQFYHDTYWMGADRAEMNRQIFASLKPGGVFGIIDHTATDTSGSRDTQTLHRVEAELIKKEILEAGFVLEATTDILRNREDSLTLSAFDPGIRGKTDRFVFKFRKPATPAEK